MKYLTSALLGLGLVFAVAVSTQAADTEEKLEGKITCAKCDLKKEEKCATVIVVKDKDKKDVVYYFDADSNKKYHGKICSDSKMGSVTGTVKKDGDKMVITVKELKFE